MRDPSSMAMTTSFDALTHGAPLVVLAPHPDDESLGCGALLAQAFAAGTGALVVCLTDGSASHKGSRRYPPSRLAALRRRELEEAVLRLGGTPRDILWLGLEDARTAGNPRIPAVIRLLCRTCQRLGAGSLFATLETDPHTDHKTAAAIAEAVAARVGLRHFGYPIWTRWQRPDFRADLTGWTEHRLPPGPHAARKRAAIAAHRSQLEPLIDDAAVSFRLDPGFVEDLSTGPELFFERSR
ncbi:PIG-L deacetylase family protein [Pararhodobacter marinus]|nr:PIG-L family deacetylase [Pararhodobacter marinus]